MISAERVAFCFKNKDDLLSQETIKLTNFVWLAMIYVFPVLYDIIYPLSGVALHGSIK